MKHLFLIILTSLLLQANERKICHEYDDNLFPQKQIIDSKHLNANLEINGYKNEVIADVSFDFTLYYDNPDSIVFYTRYLNFESISLNNNELEFSTEGDYSTVSLPENLKRRDSKGNDIQRTIKFKYTAYPPDGLYFVGWDDTTGRKKKQIWAHSPQGWLPFVNIKRDILTSEITVKFDAEYKVLSNGRRISVNDNNDGTKTWHYKIDNPHVVYLINLVIGDYQWREMQTARGLELEYWYYPEREYAFDDAYKYSLEMFDFFEEETGHNYPWNKYKQVPVIDYMYGGMETTTATIYGDYMFIDSRGWWERPYVNVNAHELVHQWFGNYVSHLNNSHVWLTESFATYYAKIFERSIYGEDYYQWERKKELDRTMEAAKNNDLPIMHSHAGSDRWYPKGSLVLDMLRNILGDDNFKAVIKYYLEQHKYSVTWTPDFIKAIREVTGESPEWFFDQWIWRGGEPHYKVAYSKISKDQKSYTLVEVEQIHEINELVKYFNMPIVFEVWYKDGSKSSVKEWVEGKYSQIMIENPDNKEIDFVIFDPGRQIIKNVSYARTASELLVQAEKAENMIDRFDALEALASFPYEQKKQAYSNIYYDLDFHLTKNEIISQIAKQDPYLEESVSQNIITSAIKDDDEWVTRAVLENFAIIPESYKDEFETLLQDSSYTNVMLALDNLCANFPADCDKYLEITENEVGWRGKNIRIKWLEIQINNGNSEYISELKDYSGLSFEFETNINSFDALKRLNILDDEILDNLFRALFHWNYKLRNNAISNLRYYYEQTKYRKLIDNYINLKEFPASKQSLINRIRS